MQNLQGFFAGRGSSMVDTQNQAKDLIGQQVAIQARYLAYIDVFYILTIISALAVPLALILRNADTKSGQGGIN